MKNAKHRNGKPRDPGARSEVVRVGKVSRGGGVRGNGNARRPVLITGGAGFIGTNLAHRVLLTGQPVLIYDNLSRRGAERNLKWLRETHGSAVQVQIADVQDFKSLCRAVEHCGQVFHFSAQVAVTTSLVRPIEDFEINARGTLNLLEALRRLEDPPPLLYTSTNKVYGNLDDVKLTLNGLRYEPEDERLRTYGFDESRPLNFHSPYGCSKGAAAEYVLDYARTFGLRAVVFHMSCIYGPHQFGNEDQGWVAHFLIRALAQTPITLYGDGKQVRDILYVDDLIEAFLLAQQNIDEISGQSFNIGGGPNNTVSLLELIDLIGELQGKRPSVQFAEWRTADQQYYVSDTRKFSALTGWIPKTRVREGLARLFRWLIEYPDAVAALANNTGEAPASNGKIVRPALNFRTAAKPLVRLRREPRSKRLWKGDADEPTDLAGKIIKFP